MNSLEQLQQRKAVLKAKIEQQRIELQNTFLEVREEIEPSFLLKKAIHGLFKPPKDKGVDASSNFFERFPLPIAFLVDLFVKNKAIATLLKMFAPAAIRIIPNLIKEHAGTDESDDPGTTPSTKSMVYGSLRQAVSAMRMQLKRSDKTPDLTPETPEK